MSTGLPKPPSPAVPEPARLWFTITARSLRLLAAVLEREAAGETLRPGPGELALLARPLQTYWQRAAHDPNRLVAAQLGLWQETLALWQRTAERALGRRVEPVIEPERGDRRFHDPVWANHPLFDFIKQSYLLANKYMMSALPEVEGPDDTRGKQLHFYTQQLADALAPTNFAATNPTVLRETAHTGGANLLRGIKNLLADLERGRGRLRVTMTDREGFTLGRNVGTTPGKVVFETDLMQLIQYEPRTRTTFERPLLIIPPWINKYYILDLQPENSFIRWAVDQGHTVFVVSWVNPDQRLAEKTFDDYLREGALAAIDAAGQATGAPRVNLVGYCLGGTLLACTLGYLAAKGDDRVQSATFLASLTDFSDPGDIGVFIDAEHLALIDAQMERDGYLDGASMATAFNTLRSNDLVWSFAVHNYLMGKDPIPFDLLYWNSDATRMPRAMHSFYLHRMYLENRLREPGGIVLDGTPIDLRRIETPTYMVSTKDDHIAPWASTYAATGLFGGPVRFVLGGSGHIAGIVNPPAQGKYGYWVNEALPADPEAWLADATRRDGSWWEDWAPWLAAHRGERIPARIPGDGRLDVIEPAPGRYALVRDEG